LGKGAAGDPGPTRTRVPGQLPKLGVEGSNPFRRASRCASVDEGLDTIERKPRPLVPACPAEDSEIPAERTLRTHSRQPGHASSGAPGDLATCSGWPKERSAVAAAPRRASRKPDHDGAARSQCPRYPSTAAATRRRGTVNDVPGSCHPRPFKCCSPLEAPRRPPSEDLQADPELRSPPVRLTPGTRVGPYEVVALLGAGGMAEVYRAKDTRLGRDVAIKVVSEALGADGAFLERFEREAKLAASLAHPNVVALHDVGFHDGKPYFVTELLQGESLRERLAKGPIPLATALEWAAQMAQGLAAAHERGIAHRDLKPENVFINRDGHVKLLDFGIAKLVEAVQGATPHSLMDETVSPSGASTGTGMVLGTPGYMSPEQVRGDPVDARTDFFSLGAVLYETLCNHRAFPGPVVESGYAILHAEPEPLPATVPLPVTQVVQRCLEKDPGRRFQSARDLAFHLELLRTPTGVTRPLEAGPEVPAKASQKPRWLWPLAAALTVLGVSGAAYVVGRASRPAMPSVEIMTFRWGRVSAGRFTPEGRVVFSAAWGGQPLELFARAPGSDDAQPLGLRDAALLGVSGNGELAILLRPRLVEGVHRGTLAVASSAGGAAREVAENVEYADWSSRGELAVVRFTGGKRQLEYPLGTPLFETTGWIYSPRISPRGDVVAFIHHQLSLRQEVLVVDRRGQVRSLFTGGPSGLAWLPSGDEVWFSTNNALWASPLSGGPKLVYQGVYEMRLEDISRSGTVLVNAEDSRRDLIFVPPDRQRERQLSWADSTDLSSISDDGRQVVFTTISNNERFTCIQPTDGAPPLKLGRGYALALSPDRKWVLSRPDEYRDALSLLPAGPGVARTVSVVGLDVSSARWLHDGRQLAFIARPRADQQSRLYLVPLEDGAPRRISDVAVNPYDIEVSNDDRFVAARALDEVVTLFPLNGGPPVPLPELGTEVAPAGWTADGQLWVRAFREVPSRLVRYDILTRRVVEERTVSPSDLTGVARIPRVRITPDGGAVAFDYERTLGYLYLLDGLVPTRR
jgi:eukaryotic-like serine/threonine-protein kinase